MGFLLAVTPICLTPGASFTLVTQRVAAGRRRDGMLVAAGTASGLCVHATLAAVGLSAVVMRSAEAFMVVKLAGAVYLIWLGSPRSGQGGEFPRRQRRRRDHRGLGTAAISRVSWATCSTPRRPRCT